MREPLKGSRDLLIAVIDEAQSVMRGKENLLASPMLYANAVFHTLHHKLTGRKHAGSEERGQGMRWGVGTSSS